MIARIGLLISNTIGRFIPDPFVLALGLTVLTAILALTIGFSDEVSVSARATLLLDAWWQDSGIWKFLLFGMQMCLILVTGFALATSRPIRKAIQLLADVPGDSGSAAAMISVIAMLVGLINWGLGLIVGALLAWSCGRSLERRSISAHYPLICAAGYTGMLVWHGGLSGSAPLTMTTSKGLNSVLPQEVVVELGIESVPLGDTIFSGLNIMVTIGLLVLVPLTLYLLAPRTREQIRTTSDLGISGRDIIDDDSAERDSMLAIALNCVVGLALLVGTVAYLATPEKGFGRIGLNQINAAMLGLGMVLHGSPRSYVRAVEEAARGCAGIIVQFPLYAGIMVMMSVSGLAGMIANRAVEGSTETTLPLLTFLSAGVVNFFVPSGGGQWGVQGPIALEAGSAAGISPSTMIMSVAYGDELTNMLQPFWALPLLAITRIRASAIVGYTAIVMVVAGLWMAFSLLVA
ncbi:MAG: TIGR00366 family protein [Planctomycetota bacterium]|nr:TIGR00366 family protein [Planctomycetota bacterium]